MTDSTEHTKDAALPACVETMTAEDIVAWIASELGCAWGPIAARIADIEHSEWVALAMSDAISMKDEVMP